MFKIIGVGYGSGINYSGFTTLDYLAKISRDAGLLHNAVALTLDVTY